MCVEINYCNRKFTTDRHTSYHAARLLTIGQVIMKYFIKTPEAPHILLFILIFIGGMHSLLFILFGYFYGDASVKQDF